MIVLLVFLFYPKYSLKTNVYQEGLWTSSSLVKSVNTNDFVVKIMGNKVDDKEVWHRLQLGLPTQPMTFDYQHKNKILQCRIEPDYLLLNLFVFGICMLFLRLVYTLYLQVVKK